MLINVSVLLKKIFREISILPRHQSVTILIASTCFMVTFSVCTDMTHFVEKIIYNASYPTRCGIQSLPPYTYRLTNRVINSTCPYVHTSPNTNIHTHGHNIRIWTQNIHESTHTKTYKYRYNNCIQIYKHARNTNSAYNLVSHIHRHWENFLFVPFFPYIPLPCNRNYVYTRVNNPYPTAYLNMC